MVDRSGKTLICKQLMLSLNIPPFAVDERTQLEISNIPVESKPFIKCSFGESIVSDIVQIRPLGLTFKEPVNLSIEHGITDLQELSSIVVKWYDTEQKEWFILPISTGRYYFIY